ncbi:hypothetical protein DNTS_009766 [Danionella cerebrum]|uniref:Cytochrome P450 family 20 subfamily A member 1 n=2 Tax=Danionella cerebrum TaxID=2873325 RepID=A0A553N031_9TELE|nr:hypothetical protein DNTS_009766 [Danionella translucida]
MLDFAIFAVTFVIILIGAVLYLYPDIVNKGSLHEFLVALHEEFGSVASFWFGRRPVVSLGSVDQLRQHINPNWTTDSFETMLKSLLGYQPSSGVAVVESLVEELVDKWASYPKSQHTPVCSHLLGLAMKAVTQLAMGSRFQDDAEVIHFRKNHEAIWSEIGKGYLDGSLERSSSRKAHYESALAEMETVLKSVATQRPAAGSMCIWAVHFLSISEAVQEQLYQELVEVLGEKPVSLQMIPKLRYCQQVLNETVRTAKLTPVAARLQEVEGKVDQHLIPKETLVIYALGVVLQDAETWSFPYRFNPDRFSDESVMKSFSLLGFSGNQACSELRFAYTVGTVLLTSLVRRLRLQPVEGQVVEARYELVSTPKDDTWVTVSERNS